jgi:hypothetical protein
LHMLTQTKARGARGASGQPARRAAPRWLSASVAQCQVDPPHNLGRPGPQKRKGKHSFFFFFFFFLWKPVGLRDGGIAGGAGRRPAAGISSAPTSLDPNLI